MASSIRRRLSAKNFVLRQMGRGFVKIGGAETDPEDIRLVEEAWEEARQAILSGVWDMVILDEINYAISYGMLDPAKVVETLEARPEMGPRHPDRPQRASFVWSPSLTPSPKCAR